MLKNDSNSTLSASIAIFEKKCTFFAFLFLVLRFQARLMIAFSNLISSILTATFVKWIELY